MKIQVLSENTSVSDKYGSEHGLSLYIETDKHKLLFDTGASGLFAKNAQKMGLDLTKIDTAVISHGHYDHGGGLTTFLQINSSAKVYLHQKAFEKHFASRAGGIKADIGLDEALLSSERFVWCGDSCFIDENLELFSGVKAARFVPSGNKDLWMQAGDTLVQDTFAHEQNLIIRQGGKTLLIAGCAHNGIINIIDAFKVRTGHLPDYVMGGFHLYSLSSRQSEAPAIVDEIGGILLETHAHYYTCHCTGIESYQRLKAVMGENIEYIAAGDQFIINM